MPNHISGSNRPIVTYPAFRLQSWLSLYCIIFGALGTEAVRLRIQTSIRLPHISDRIYDRDERERAVGAGMREDARPSPSEDFIY